MNQKLESVEMYTKSACPFCVKAKQLLDSKDIPYDSYEVGQGVTKEDIQSRVDAMGVNTEIRTVPQIFAEVEGSDDWLYIGGYQELKNYLTS